MKKQKGFFAISLALLAGVMAATGFTLFSLSGSVKELSVEITKSTANAILASARVTDETVVKVPVLYYDQVMDECTNLYDSNSSAKIRQFEWASCEYYNSAIETGLTEPVLNDQFLPVAIGGELLPNRGLASGFSRWFSAEDGKSKSYAGTIALNYDADTASFSYESESFYPLNEIAIPAESVNEDGNNHLFTLNLGVPVQILMDGKEEFAITADDDTWVYIGSELVIDMGGVHNATTGRLKILENGEVYTAINEEDFAYSGVRVYRDSGTVVRIFHADRNSSESVFKIKFSNMLLNITDTTIASGNSVEVAYNPENPSYIAPLGESLRVEPDKSKMILAVVTAQAFILSILMIIFAFIIFAVWRYAHRDRIPE